MMPALPDRSKKRAKLHAEWRGHFDSLLADARKELAECSHETTVDTAAHQNGRHGSSKQDSRMHRAAEEFCTHARSLSTFVNESIDESFYLPTYASLDLVQQALRCVYALTQDTHPTDLPLARMLDSTRTMLEMLVRLSSAQVLVHRSMWLDPLSALMTECADRTNIRLSVVVLVARLAELFGGYWLPSNLGETFCQTLLRDTSQSGECLFWEIRAFHGISATCGQSQEMSRQISRVLRSMLGSSVLATSGHVQAVEAWQDFLLYVANDPDHSVFVRHHLMSASTHSIFKQPPIEALLHPTTPAMVTTGVDAQDKREEAQDGDLQMREDADESAEGSDLATGTIDTTPKSYEKDQRDPANGEIREQTGDGDLYSRLHCHPLGQNTKLFIADQAETIAHGVNNGTSSQILVGHEPGSMSTQLATEQSASLFVEQAPSSKVPETSPSPLPSVIGSEEEVTIDAEGGPDTEEEEGDVA